MPLCLDEGANFICWDFWCNIKDKGLIGESYVRDSIGRQLLTGCSLLFMDCIFAVVSPHILLFWIVGSVFRTPVEKPCSNCFSIWSGLIGWIMSFRREFLGLFAFWCNIDGFGKFILRAGTLAFLTSDKTWVVVYYKKVVFWQASNVQKVMEFIDALTPDGKNWYIRRWKMKSAVSCQSNLQM